MKDSQSSTANSLMNEGSRTSHSIAGYAVRIIKVVKATSKGLRPTLSENDPITGSQKRLEAPTQSVTIRLDLMDKCRTELPNVGVYAVIM